MFVCSFFCDSAPPSPCRRARSNPDGGKFALLRACSSCLSFHRLRHRSLCLGVCAENRLYYARGQYRVGITSRHTIPIRIVTTTIRVLVNAFKVRMCLKSSDIGRACPFFPYGTGSWYRSLSIQVPWVSATHESYTSNRRIHWAPSMSPTYAVTTGYVDVVRRRGSRAARIPKGSGVSPPPRFLQRFSVH